MIETCSLIGDLDMQSTMVQAATYLDVLLVIQRIAMPNGIYKRLLHRQPNPKHLALRPLYFRELCQ